MVGGRRKGRHKTRWEVVRKVKRILEEGSMVKNERWGRRKKKNHETKMY